jgi:hypothetical protein
LAGTGGWILLPGLTYFTDCERSPELPRKAPDSSRAGDQVKGGKKKMAKPLMSILPGAVLVVSEWHDADERDHDHGGAYPSTIRGVCSSTEELLTLLQRLKVYWPEENDLILQSCAQDMPSVDPDLRATSRILIAYDDGSSEETDFYIWSSAKSEEAYAPLKLYWCTTDGNEEDWFIIAHTARGAALQHAANEGFDPEDPSAEFVMVLPPELQNEGDETGGWPSMEMLAACGATIVREESPRVVQIGERTFSEGMMDRMVEMARSGQRPEDN